MEMMVKKYQQKFRKVRDEMASWEELQSRFLSQFRNASSIIQRLTVLGDGKNYGELADIHGLKEVLLGKQMESLGSIFCSMRETLKEFNIIVMSLEKIVRDGNQLLKGGSMLPTTHQMQLQVGIRPSVEDCLDGLKSLNEMHFSEYLVKKSAVEALTLNSSANDLGALYQLLVDQPNISKQEVHVVLLDKDLGASEGGDLSSTGSLHFVRVSVSRFVRMPRLIQHGKCSAMAYSQPKF